MTKEVPFTFSGVVFRGFHQPVIYFQKRDQRITADTTVMSLHIDAYETENVKLIHWSARPKTPRSFCSTCLSYSSSIGEVTVHQKKDLCSFEKCPIMSQPLGKTLVWTFCLFFSCFSFEITHQHLWGLRDNTVLTWKGVFLCCCFFSSNKQVILAT